MISHITSCANLLVNKTAILGPLWKKLMNDVFELIWLTKLWIIPMSDVSIVSCDLLKVGDIVYLLRYEHQCYDFLLLRPITPLLIVTAI
jgi:hypothetical protein